MSVNYYQVLELHSEASQLDIKRAYRRLAKQFHPDSNRTIDSHDRISCINAAYEVLGDPIKRRRYDVQLRYSTEDNPAEQRQQAAHRRAARSETAYSEVKASRRRSYGQNSDAQLQNWLTAVYRPIDKHLTDILGSLDGALDQLAADPFDDELMEEFQDYLDTCRTHLDWAQHMFRSTPNPKSVAATASGLYYCLNQVGDGLDEFERFTSCYNEHYIHTGRELFRISRQLHHETQETLQNLV